MTEVKDVSINNLAKRASGKGKRAREEFGRVCTYVCA